MDLQRFTPQGGLEWEGRSPRGWWKPCRAAWPSWAGTEVFLEEVVLCWVLKGRQGAPPPPPPHTPGSLPWSAYAEISCLSFCTASRIFSYLELASFCLVLAIYLRPTYVYRTCRTQMLSTFTCFSLVSSQGLWGLVRTPALQMSELRCWRSALSEVPLPGSISSDTNSVWSLSSNLCTSRQRPLYIAGAQEMVFVVVVLRWHKNEVRLFFRGQRRRLSPGCTDTARRRFASLVTLHRTCCGELSGLYLVSLGQEVSEPWGKLKLTPGGPVWPLPIPPLPSPLLPSPPSPPSFS